jgi:hypothetical protein
MLLGKPVPDPKRSTRAELDADHQVRLRVHLADNRYPKLRFLKEFLQHLGLIAIVDVSIRIFLYCVGFVHSHIPVEDLPKDLDSYMSVSVPRTFVTVMDAVAILLSIILGIVTVVKMIQEYWRDMKL